MSIIIKGVDLPKGYGHICLEIYPNGDVEAEWDQDSKDYQAIQIPNPHGDLIDRNQVFAYSHRDVQNLEEVPVILEGEE